MQESNNNHFDAEHSKNGIDFEKIGEVAGAGTSSIQHNYNYLHRTPVNGMNYYRLKQVDTDNKFTYSEIRSVKFDNIKSVTVFPNPTTDKVYINHGENNVKLTVIVSNTDGKQLQRYSNFPSGNSIDLSGYINNIYFIKIIDRNGNQTVKKVMKK